MAYERARFGDGVTNVTQDVHTHFGPRKSQGADGVVKTEGSRYEASWEVTGRDVGKTTEFERWLVQPVIPAGAVIESVYAKVKEAFDLGGTTPVIQFGTSGSVDTNGFVVDETTAETEGTYDLTSTLVGTWAAPLAAETKVDVALDGTTPTVTDAGVIEVVVTYIVV